MNFARNQGQGSAFSRFLSCSARPLTGYVAVLCCGVLVCVQLARFGGMRIDVTPELNADQASLRLDNLMNSTKANILVKHRSYKFGSDVINLPPTDERQRVQRLYTKKIRDQGLTKALRTLLFRRIRYTRFCHGLVSRVCAFIAAFPVQRWAFYALNVTALHGERINEKQPLSA